jgi:hypothetical protein
MDDYQKLVAKALVSVDEILPKSEHFQTPFVASSVPQAQSGCLNDK